MAIDENEALLQKVKVVRILERVLDRYDAALSVGQRENIRAALESLDRDFRKAFGRTLPRKPKAVLPAAEAS